MTKPRIYFKWHVWCCATQIGRLRFDLGYGYTPKEAYDDWRKQCASHSN